MLFSKKIYGEELQELIFTLVYTNYPPLFPLKKEIKITLSYKIMPCVILAFLL
jgi:hypothetical protein